MVFIVSLESFECQNHRIFDKNKLRKALCLVARFVSFYYNYSGQAVSRRYFFHACWHGLCGFLALCRCFLQFFVSFIICFFENNFQYCNGITCFFSWWLYFITKNCSRFRKIEKKQNLF